MPEPLVFLSPLHKAARQIGIHLSAAVEELDLPGNEAHVLSYLGSYAPVPISELVRVFGLKKSTLTSMLDRMEARGLVRREVHPEDRRSFLVHLTRRGRSLSRRVRVITEDLERRIREGITEGDLAGFRRVMESIAGATGVRIRSNGTERKPEESP